MSRTFIKTLSVQIDDYTLSHIVEMLLDEVIFDSDLLDCINDSLDDESREALELMIENDDFVKDDVISYVKEEILKKFKREKE